jgi:hypothetical protein
MRSGRSKPPPPGRNEIWPYALLSLTAFVCACSLLAAFLWHADKIVQLGLTGKLYYIVLLPLGLCVSAFLFGALRSIGKYRGKLFGGVLELGGPAVAFFLAVVLGFALPEPAQNFPLTVIVHGKEGLSDMVLRSRGSVVLDTGELRRTASIGANGDAVFLEIPANMRGKTASVGLDTNGFELVDTNPTLTLSPSTFYLEVRRKLGRLAGHVTSSRQPLPGVTVAVGKTQTTTNDEGYFEMQIALNDAHSDLTVVATKPGYKAWTGFGIPDSNDMSITLDKLR